MKAKKSTTRVHLAALDVACRMCVCRVVSDCRDDDVVDIDVAVDVDVDDDARCTMTGFRVQTRKGDALPYVDVAKVCPFRSLLAPFERESSRRRYAAAKEKIDDDARACAYASRCARCCLQNARES